MGERKKGRVWGGMSDIYLPCIGCLSLGVGFGQLRQGFNIMGHDTRDFDYLHTKCRVQES